MNGCPAFRQDEILTTGRYGTCRHNQKDRNLNLHRFENLNPRISNVLDTHPTGWTIWFLGFDSWRGLRIFLFTIVSRTALGPSQPPVQWVLGVLSLGVKRPVREADHQPPCRAEVKE